VLSIDVVKNYIQLTRADNSIELFSQAIDVFDYYEFPGYLATYEDALFSYEEATDENRVRFIFQKTREMLRDLLMNQGISIQEDVQFSKLVELAKGVRAIQDHTPDEEIIRVLESDSGPVEKLAVMVEMCSRLPAHETLPMLVDVNESIVDILKHYFEEKHTQHDEPLDSEQLKQWAAWKQHASIIEIDFIYRFSLQSASMNLPFQVYMNIWMKEHYTDLGDMPTVNGMVDKVARDLLSMAFVSSDYWKQPLIQLKPLIRTLHLDALQVTKLDMALTDSFIKFTQRG
jgi:hypothetical protein